MPTIGVCTSSKRSSIKGLLSMLERIPSLQVMFINLPYNDIKNYKLPAEEIDGLILCHSIHNRRFAISDVTDALYNEFLSHAAATLGKSNIAVIAHDFKWPFKSDDHRSSHSQLKGAKMDSFRIQQPTVFECSSLTMICGQLDKKTQIDEEDLKHLEAFTTSVHKVKPTPSDSRGDQTSWLRGYSTILKILAVIVTFMLAQHFLIVCIKMILSGSLKVAVVLLVGFVVIPFVCFLWQKYVNKCQKSGPLPGRNLSRPSIHQWYAYPWWQVHIPFWQYYSPKVINYAMGLVKKITDLM